MSVLALALFAQLAMPARTTLPVLDFPERDLDDRVAYQGYQTRLRLHRAPARWRRRGASMGRPGRARRPHRPHANDRARPRR
jgi:hypothetical protein